MQWRRYLALALMATGGALASRPAAAASPHRHTSWLAPQFRDELARNGVVYVTDTGNELVDIFSIDSSHALLGQITDGICIPWGVAVDASGTVYVASSIGECVYGGPDIAVFPAGQTTPSAIISNGMYNPDQLAINPVNQALFTTGGGNNVIEYAHGKTTVERFIVPVGAAPKGLAVDAQGNLFVAYRDYYSDTINHIGVYDVATRRFADTGITPQTVNGIAFDKSGNLVVCDQGPGTVSVYAPGATTPLHVYTGFQDPVIVAFDSTGTRLFVDDPGNREVFELDYPSGKQLTPITGFQDNTYGIAVSPPLGTASLMEGK
jgi:DNA-binding beta-propeller fold protein YncE